MNIQTINTGDEWDGILLDGDVMSCDSISGRSIVTRMVADAGGMRPKVFRVPIRMMDAAPATGPTATGLSEAERKAVIARAKMIHENQHAWMKDRAPAFTTAAGEAAVRQAEAAKLAASAGKAIATESADRARGAAAAARQMMIERTRSAWKGSRK